jgi:predicted transcriptional regulator
MILIFAGVVTILGGALIGGLWWIFIGLFLRGASRMSLTRLRMRQALEGEPVSRFMKTGPVTVPRDTTISELVEDYVYRHHFKLYPVVNEGKLEGCITTRDIKSVPRQDWENRTVSEISRGCSIENTIEADADAVEALRKMRGTDSSRLMVLDGGKLVGIITLKDVLHLIALKIDLEEEGE